LLVATGCGGDDEPSGGAAKDGADTGETITMWTHVATQTQSERLVKAYNASHENQVKLTVIPTWGNRGLATMRVWVPEA
jgi:multiple sugar transport system substrate-binding protein